MSARGWTRGTRTIPALPVRGSGWGRLLLHLFSVCTLRLWGFCDFLGEKIRLEKLVAGWDCPSTQLTVRLAYVHKGGWGEATWRLSKALWEFWLKGRVRALTRRGYQKDIGMGGALGVGGCARQGPVGTKAHSSREVDHCTLGTRERGGRWMERRPDLRVTGCHRGRSQGSQVGGALKQASLKALHPSSEPLKHRTNPAAN